MRGLLCGRRLRRFLWVLDLLAQVPRRKDGCRARIECKGQEWCERCGSRGFCGQSQEISNQLESHVWRTGRAFEQKGNVQFWEAHVVEPAAQVLGKGCRAAGRDLVKSVKDTLMIQDGESIVGEHVHHDRAKGLVIKMLRQSTENKALEAFPAVNRDRFVDGTHETIVAATGDGFKRICDCVIEVGDRGDKIVGFAGILSGT